jgi:hypothetical protein
MTFDRVRVIRPTSQFILNNRARAPGTVIPRTFGTLHPLAFGAEGDVVVGVVVVDGAGCTIVNLNGPRLCWW